MKFGLYPSYDQPLKSEHIETFTNRVKLLNVRLHYKKMHV